MSTADQGVPSPTSHLFNPLFAQPEGSPIRELFPYLSRPGMLSLAGGYPSPGLFDAEGLQQAAMAALQQDAAASLQYGASEGQLPLREALAALCSTRGIACTPADMIVTTGSQQAFDLLVKVLVEPGDPVLVEVPAYPATLQTLKLAQAQVVSVPTDEQGLDTEALARLLAQWPHARRPKLLYTVPNFSNPGGTLLPAARRTALVELARQHGFAISYEFKPGERLSESELALRLGVSRTPVREALTRLVADGFLLPASRGYMRRELDVKESLDLYEARVAVERECVRLAVERATEEQLGEAQAYLEQSQRVPPGTPIRQLVDLDEGFHLRIADMAGNAELRRMLVSLNERIRFIRWIDMESVGRDSTQREHLEILRALSARDAQASERLMAEHIGLRREQIVEAIARGLTRIYLPQEQVQATP
jgi:DNA-binding transcriptional MocR family regulator